MRVVLELGLSVLQMLLSTANWPGIFSLLSIARLASLGIIFFHSDGNPRNKRRASSICPGLHKHINHINDDTFWLIGKNSSVNFWTDNWLGYKLCERIDILAHILDLQHCKVVIISVMASGILLVILSLGFWMWSLNLAYYDPRFWSTDLVEFWYRIPHFKTCLRVSSLASSKNELGPLDLGSFHSSSTQYD